MVYCEYYNRIFTLQGVPKLSVDQNKKLLNTISLEVRINEIEKLEKILGTNKALWQRKENLRSQLFDLTQLDPPHKWMEDLIIASKNEF